MSVTTTPEGTEAQVEETQGTPAPETAPAQAEAPTQGSGPWAQDLASIFEDEAVRGQVDGFLREKVQPYTTKLEQERAGLADAERLWTDLSTNPLDAYLQLTQELFDPEAAQVVIDALNPGDFDGFEELPQEGEQPQRDPEVEAMLEEHRNSKIEAVYNSELQRVVAANPGVPGLQDNLHPFIAAHEGDFDTALEHYKQIVSGIAPAQTTGTPTAPPVIGSTEAAPAGTPPIQKHYSSISDAVDDFTAELAAANAPATVGSV